MSDTPGLWPVVWQRLRHLWGVGAGGGAGGMGATLLALYAFATRRLSRLWRALTMSNPALGRLPALHGWSLVLMAAAVPLGEGVALGFMGVAWLCLLARAGAVDWRIFRAWPGRTVLLGWGVWLASGMAAWHFGGEGILRPAALAGWSPLLVLPLVLLSATCVGRRYWLWAVTAFVTTAALSWGWGLLQIGFDWRTATSLAKATSGMGDQSLIPGLAHAGATGFFRHRLKMAHVSLLPLGLLFARQLFGAMGWRRRGLEGLLFVLGTAALLLTYTRGALLAFVAACAVCVLLARSRVRWVALTLMLAGTVGAASVPSVRARVISMADGGQASIRTFLWGHGVQIIADHPLGVGLGNYTTMTHRYYDVLDPHMQTRTYPHSVVLATWAETGPLGLLGWAGSWAVLLAWCVGVLWRTRGPPVGLAGDTAAARGWLRPPKEQVSAAQLGAEVERLGLAEVRVAAATGVFACVAYWVLGFTHDVFYHLPVALAFVGTWAAVLVWLDGWLLAAVPPWDDGPTIEAP